MQLKEESLMRITVLVVSLLALTASLAGAQEVVIKGFPLGVGASIGQEFWEPYTAALSDWAATLKSNPQALGIIVGRADGTRYRDASDAKNPGLSLGRAHALRNLLVSQFGVDSTRLLIQTNDVPDRGEEYRSVSVRLVLPPEQKEVTAVPVNVSAPANEAPVTEPPTELTEVTNNFYDQMTLRLGGGASSTPFGGIPMLTGAVVWRGSVALNVVVGHSFWNDSYEFKGASLKTWLRMVGGGLTVYPWRNKPIGVVGGWMRVEQIAQSYYEYVKLSEGPVLGVSATPVKHLSLSALYNPSRQRLEGTDLSSSKGGQFLFGVSVFTDFGGSR
jgi:hypothetical protein